MAEGLSMLRDAMCSAETSVGGRGCASGAFRLDVTRIRRTARLYVDCQYIPITLKDIGYLSRMFSVMQQQLRDYIVALKYVLPYVTASLTSLTYVEPAPDASRTLIPSPV